MRQFAVGLAFALCSQLANAAPEVADCSTPASASSDTAWVKGSRQDYPAAGSGFSIGYRINNGFGTVYVYDADISDWREGISDSRLTRMIEEVLVGLQELERRGTFSELSVGRPSARRLFCRDSLFLTARGKLNGRPFQSTAAVFVLNGKILKFRTTFFAEPPGGIEAATEALVQEALGGDALR